MSALLSEKKIKNEGASEKNHKHADKTGKK
jgi:hypothetical protein